MIDITKPRNNYTKFPNTLKQKCEPVLLVQKKQQEQPQHQLKHSKTSKTVTSHVKKQSSTIYSELKPTLTVRQIGGNLSGRTIGIGRGIPIATRIETVLRNSPLSTAVTAAATATITTTTRTITTTTTTTTTTAAVTATKTTTETKTSTANAVRKANQQFFLIPDFQDKNFLKNECAVAHAQVATQPSVTPTLGKRSLATRNVTRKSSAIDSKDTIGSKPCNSTNNNNNNNNIFSYLSQHQLQSQQQQQHESIRLNTSKVNITNVMRRSAVVGSGSGYGNTLDSITTSTTKTATKTGTAPTPTTTATTSSTHKIEIQFNGVKSSNTVQAKSTVLHTNNPGTKTSLSSLSSLSYNNTTGKASNNVVSSKLPIKPLVHRSLTTATTTTTLTVNNRTTGGENLAYTNSVNNNSNNNNNNLTNPTSNNQNNTGHTINNNSMAASTSGVATIDHDDIKYIDSDENTGMTPPVSGKFVDCVEPPVPALINKPITITSATRIRPKSTIVCSNNHVFEKINTYKYSNGNNGTTNATIPAESLTPIATTTSSIAKRQINTNIDSNSIKASIEKFNNFSEQKRLPLANAVTLRAHSGATSGSTSNLQYHRHSGSDFDSCNLRQLSNINCNSNGGSLTRNNYRASSALNSINSSGIPQSAPLKAKVHLSEASVTAASTPNTTIYKTINKIQQNATASDSAPNEIRMAAGDESIRGVSTKSVLPPASPTTSRYWDRDSSRTSSASLSSHNHLDGGKSSSDEKSEGLCGLRNIGNTCFMNSIIQCLSHTNELTKFLRNYSGMRPSSSTKDQQILQEFARLIREMWTSNVHSVTPMDLKRAFSTKHRMYSDYNQQDAQEFLRFFLDSLHSALNSGVKQEPLNIDDNLSDNKKAELTWEWYTRHENSLIRDLFVGQLKSTLRCTACGNTSVTFDPFWDLSVSLPSSSRCKLDTCLEMFIREEVLDGDEMPTCARCKTRRKCTKSFTIQRFPKYLVIHLKRFSETRWSKLSNIVEFPTGERELNMGPYGANANTNMYYSLYAISNHMGSTAGGHYVALCKHPITRRWHEFNDNIVSEPLSESHLVSSSAYILFYERA